jgi:hypothetical protein
MKKFWEWMRGKYFFEKINRQEELEPLNEREWEGCGNSRKMLIGYMLEYLHEKTDFEYSWLKEESFIEFYNALKKEINRIK